MRTRIDTAPDVWEICKKKVKINGKSLLQQHMLILFPDRQERREEEKGKRGINIRRREGVEWRAASGRCQGDGRWTESGERLPQLT